MTKLVKILLILLCCSTFAYADSESSCLKHLNTTLLGPNDLVSIDNTFDIPFLTILSVERLDINTQMLMHRTLINSVTSALRDDFNYATKLKLEDLKVILQVFKTYEALATKRGFNGNENLKPLNDPETITLAVLEFNNIDNPNRAEDALETIRKIRPAVLYKKERPLRLMVLFLQANGEYEASYRIIKLINRRLN